MLRYVLTLALICAALNSGGQSANAAGNELSACLDPSTTLLAGGDVGDKELAAGQTACVHLQKTTQDEKTLMRINFAAETLAAEAKHRQSKH